MSEIKTASQQLAETQKQLEQLRAREEELLKQTRDEDLETVKRLIKTHGFTQTQLRSCFGKGTRSSSPRKSTRGRKSK